MFKLYNRISVVRSVFHEGNNISTQIYRQVFLDECLYKLLKNNDNNISDSIIILRFGKTKTAKEEFYGAKNE